MSFVAAMLIPPPPDWQPPYASGPGLYCGHVFGVDILEGERVSAEWPGEIFMNDLYGTHHIDGPHGRVTISENGERTRPTGDASLVGAVGDLPLRRYDERTYAMELSGDGRIRAVSIRFPEAFSVDERRRFLERLHATKPEGVECLEPENR